MFGNIKLIHVLCIVRLKEHILLNSLKTYYYEKFKQRNWDNRKD